MLAELNWFSNYSKYELRGIVFASFKSGWYIRWFVMLVDQLLKRDEHQSYLTYINLN